MTSRTRVAVLLALAATFAAVGATSASGAQPHLPVYFLQGEQLARVTRPGATPLDAVRQLIAGPTPAERALDFRTYVPASTRVLSLKVADGIATVDLNERFASGGDSESLLARLSQLVRTLTGLQGATKVQLLINGAVAPARFPGVSTSGPITFRLLQTPNVPVPTPPQPRLPAPDPAVKTLQQRLIELGYLLEATTTVASGLRPRTRSSRSRNGSGSTGRACWTARRRRGSPPPRTRRRSARAALASAPRSCSTARSRS